MSLLRMSGLGLILMAAQAHANELQPLPDLNVAEKDLGDARKFVVFHSRDVTAEQAEADLLYCYQFLPHGVARRAASFVPWSKSDSANPVTYGGGSYGLVGYGIAAIIDGPLERSIRQSRLYRCMIPKGYDRYRTSEAVWKRLNENNGLAGVKLQARIAAGPPPPTARVLP
jgi:hypothetical protein